MERICGLLEQLVDEFSGHHRYTANGTCIAPIRPWLSRPNRVLAYGLCLLLQLNLLRVCVAVAYKLNVGSQLSKLCSGVVYWHGAPHALLHRIEIEILVRLRTDFGRKGATLGLPMTNFQTDLPRFCREPRMKAVSIEAGTAGESWCKATMTVLDCHRHDDGLVEPAIIAALAEHAARCAARSVSRQGDVYTVELKLNFLRPVVGHQLLCKAKVVRQGDTLIVTEAEVFCSIGSEVKFDDDPAAKVTEIWAVIQQ